MTRAALVLVLAVLLLGCGSKLNAVRIALTPIAIGYNATATDLGAEEKTELDVCTSPSTPPAEGVACVDNVVARWADRKAKLKAVYAALKASERALEIAEATEEAGGAVDLEKLQRLVQETVDAAAAFEALGRPAGGGP